MKVATLSFKLIGTNMALSGSERAQIIRQCIEDHRPDFFACAGWSLESVSQVKELTKASKGFPGTTLLVEVQHDEILAQRGHALAGSTQNYKTLPGHAMYIICNGNSRCLGEQFFATSSELKGKGGDERLLALENDIDKRTFNIGDIQVVALCCGELNVLRGRDRVECRSEKVGKVLTMADIVVNPTHDRMGNYGTVKKKREHLSSQRLDGWKVSISISNWNVAKQRQVQKQNTDTLHSLFLNGEAQEWGRHHREGEYELRLYEIHSESLKRPKNKPAKRPKAVRGKAALPLYKFLQTIDPDVSPEHQFDWLYLPNSSERTKLESKILDSLRTHCDKTANSFKSAKKKAQGANIFPDDKIKGNTRKLEFDFYLPKYNLAIEFDESQHFTLERAVTYMHYSNDQVAYDKDRWFRLCKERKRNDSDPPERDWQRAYRDTIRDLRAKEYGVTLIRLYQGDYGADQLKKKSVRDQLNRDITGHH